MKNRPDFDGVYRTKEPDAVFRRKKRETDLPTTSPHSSPRAKKNTASPLPIGGNLPTSPVIPPYKGGYLRGEGNGEVSPAPVSPQKSVGKFAGKKPKKPPFVIVEDTREQTPLRSWPDGAAVITKGLETGDYSIDGWENCFAIERKSITDLAGTMMNGYEANTQRPRKRFNNELERLRHFDCAAVIITATPRELLDFHHNCGMDAHAALWNFSLSIFATYGIPVFPLTDEATAARWIYDLARHYINTRTKKNRTREESARKIAEDWKF